MFLFRSAFMEALHHEKPMCVVHAAHAAEILLKARIAQEHPLLIFSKLPKASPTKDTLTLIDLLENGRTLSYEELPNQLWATTGIRIDKVEQYRAFGRLRNQIIHLSLVNADTREDELTIRYSLEVLDPLVESFWGKSVIDFITNDPYYADDVYSGSLEQSIRNFFEIDQRLRRLLGDASKRAWEHLNAHLNGSYKDATDEEWERWNQSKTSEDWEAEYESFLMSQPENQAKQQAEDAAHWNAFLDSF